MKPLNFFIAVLCVTSSVVTLVVEPAPLHRISLLPRGRDNDALRPHKGSSRGGLNRDNAQPPCKAPHSEEDVQRAKDTITKGKTVKLPDPATLRRSKTPEEGDDAFTHDPKTKVSKVYLGDVLEIPSRQTEMRHRHDPSEKGYLYQPRAQNKGERKEGERQRRHAYRNLETSRGIVNDHKGPVSSHYAKKGQVASVAIDNQRSQNFEGQLIKAANKPVIEAGYKDSTDSSTWKGEGGVMFVPNARNKAPLRPEIGPPESKPHKYSVTEDSDYEIAPRKRDRHSRSSSDDSLTVISKPPKKSQRHGGNSKSRRGIAVIDTIASQEAAASSTGSKPQNSSRETPEELQAYMDAWNIVRDNATDTLWPFIVDMLEGTNSTLVITVAWSVYAHMLPTPYAVSGPFHYGWTSLYSQEEQWAKDGNISNATLSSLYEINDVLIDLYSTAWDGGYDALNSTGVLNDLDWLGQAIMAYNTSVPLGSTLSPGDEDPYANFFLSYLSIVPDDELDLNSTTSSNASLPRGLWHRSS